jgi:hypothetical protein
MNVNQAQIKQMKNEDAKFGEKQQKKSQQIKVKQKNQPNFAKMSVQDVMHMNDEDFEDDENYDM